MALKDLKSNLSTFRKPLKQNPVAVSQNAKRVQDFKTVPLAERTPDIIDKRTGMGVKNPDIKIINSSQQSGRHTMSLIETQITNPSGRHLIGTDISITSNPSGRHLSSLVDITPSNLQSKLTVDTSNLNIDGATTKLQLGGRHEMGRDVENTSPISGRHNDGKDVSNTSAISGRHNDGKDVSNTSAISGRHTTGEDVSNNSAISGRHTMGVDTTNNSPLSGRHTTGKDVTNNSLIIGRHETDNSNFNIDGQVPLTNPAGRHTLGVDTSNNSPLSGRHTIGVDVTNNSPLGGRHETPHDIDHSTLDIDSNLVQLGSSLAPGQHYPNHNPQHSNLDIDAIPSQYTIDVSDTPIQQSTIAITQALPFQLPGFTLNQSETQINTSISDVLPNIKDGFIQKQTTTNLFGITDSGNEISFEYPDSVVGGRLMEISKYKLKSQLGEGTIIPNAARYTGKVVKMMISQTGWHDERKYDSVVGKSQSRTSGLLIQYTKKNSPSLLEEQYKEFNLQEDSYNPFYIKQPYILRGIQRPEDPSPQLWGGSPFGDPFVRGGIVTQTERALFDLVRINKLLLSPQGLLWGAKQQGLALSNPAMETATGLVPFGIPTDGPIGISNPIGDTRIFTGLGVLGSVPGQGLHITRHGVPFINAVASYENVINAKINNWNLPGYGPSVVGKIALERNRLETLVYELIGTNKISTMVDRLSHIGGAQSVYGIIGTTINRVTNTTDKIEHNIDSVKRRRDLGPAQTSIQAYSTVAYGNLTRGSDSFNDFRKSIGDVDSFGIGNKSFKGDTTNVNYTEQNQVTRFGMGEHGKPGVDRSDYTKSHVRPDGTLDNSPQGFRGDKINAYDAQIGDNAKKYKDITDLKDPSKNGSRDFIDFYFNGPRNPARGTTAGGDGEKSELIMFRATVNNYSDNYSPSWNGHSLMGRADQAWMYNQWARTVSFDFKVAPTSRDELKPIWRKLNYLASWTAPAYSGKGLVNPMIRLTLGNLFQQTPCFINSLTYTTDGESPWEINLEGDSNMMQVPKYINVSITLQMILDYRPQFNGRMYSLSDVGRHDESEGNWLSDASNAYFGKPKEDRTDTHYIDNEKVGDSSISDSSDEGSDELLAEAAADDPLAD